MKIIHVSAEMAPIAKIGGLGDVSYGLAMAQKNLGHDVSVIIPRYDVLQSAYVTDISLAVKHLTWNYYGTAYSNSVWKGNVNGLQVFFIDSSNPAEFFDRGKIYGCPDDIIRFLYFSRTVVEFLQRIDTIPDVLHVHEWQSAAVIPLVKQMKLSCRLIFTIHNMEYQGRCSPKEATSIGIIDNEHLRDDTYPEAVNLLKAAIQAADQVTTVSPTYALETKSQSQGMGLEKTLQKHKKKYRGILNGIDSKYWNPEHDPYIPRHYSEKSFLKGKKLAKDILRRRLQLEVADKPLVANVGRLVPQKGVDLLRDAIHYTLENGGQFILQGTSPIEEIKKDFCNLKESFSDNPNVHIEMHLEEELTHMIYAAADLFLVPSLFEPCGLTQQIALKYGAIPVVRNTGGLADTVRDASCGEEGNGFVFEEPTKEALHQVLNRAMTFWKENKNGWNELVLKGVKKDFGWKLSAEKYLEIYK